MIKIASIFRRIATYIAILVLLMLVELPLHPVLAPAGVVRAMALPAIAPRLFLTAALDEGGFILNSN